MLNKENLFYHLKTRNSFIINLKIEICFNLNIRIFYKPSRFINQNLRINFLTQKLLMIKIYKKNSKN
jgi:hypothetical protein